MEALTDEQPENIMPQPVAGGNIKTTLIITEETQQ